MKKVAKTIRNESAKMEMSDLQPVDRKSIAYFPSVPQVSLDDGWSMGNGHMFFEDVHTQIMPYRTEHRPNFLIEVSPDDEKTRGRVVATFSKNEASYRGFTDQISEFIRDVAGQIAYQGTAHYEITQVEAIAAKAKWSRGIKGISVGERFCMPFYIPGRVVTVGGRVLQVVPPAERKKGHPLVISIPKSKVWSVSVPEALGGLRDYRRLRRSLIVASEVVPRFVKQRNPFFERNLDLNDFLVQRHPLVAKGSAMWGWPARWLWQQETLEYYQLYRELWFARSLAILREHVLGAMNELLVRTKVPARLLLQGLPSPYEIEDCVHKLASGSLSFQACYEVIRL
jgi:hypothetical protein